MRPRALYPSLAALLCVTFPQLVSGQNNPAATAPRTGAKKGKPAAGSLPESVVKPVAPGPQEAAGIEFFEKKIRPVLAEQCYSCHSAGAGKSMGKLQLDSRPALMKGGETGPILVPGHPESSRLIEAITYANPDLTMPPKGKLPDTVIADLKQWVKMGAPWAGSAPGEQSAGALSADPMAQRLANARSHWAYRPVTCPPLPAVKNRAWVKNPIDQFVLAKLEANHLSPSPPADRRTLIRRAYFDLLGLPPTPEEVEAFVADRDPNAWEKLVDRLLASPHYGERWGRFWLDVARYGEDQAHTFEARLYPQGFRYRDWVAHALNTDMPYDRFIKEQLAADLLKEPDMAEQLPALGMFATGPVYYGDEKMFDQYDDRIDTLCRGFLGVTVACARCHDHKFDPVSQKDYYALAGVFASTGYEEVSLPQNGADDGWGKSGALPDHRARVNEKSQAVEKYLAEQEQQLRTSLTARISDCMVAAWKLRNRRKADPKVSPDAVAAAEKLPRVVLDRWAKYLDEGAGKSLPQLEAWRQLLQQEDARTDLSASEPRLAEVRKTAQAFQDYVAGLVARRAGTGEPRPQPLDKTETQTLDAINGKDGALAVPKDQVEKALPETARPRLAELKSELEKVKAEPFIHALTEGSHVGNVHVLLRGNLKTPGPEAPRRFLAVVAGENAAPFQKGSGRLELANAIAAPSNPLTARVMVNRVWQHHFGTGIVRTASNFGILGEPPTHPELLDWLTSHFVAGAGVQGPGAGESRVAPGSGNRATQAPPSIGGHPAPDPRTPYPGLGWSLKKLHRLILLSNTYQQNSGRSSATTGQKADGGGQSTVASGRKTGVGTRKMAGGAGHHPATPQSASRIPKSAIRNPQSNNPQSIDPDDRLLWRMPVRRLEVEAWRDAMLSVSGKLDETIGGPSVPLASADNRRRTFYAQISRHDLDPMLRMFDFPDANVTSDHRTTTTVPLQELFVLNSEFMIRQAKAFAARLTANPQEDDATRIRRAFQLAYGRMPSERELSLGLAFVTKPADPGNAGKLTRWEEYAQVLLSSNEFMYVE